MDPTLHALLTSWDWRPEVILVLALGGAFYLTGWLRLRRRGRRQLATIPRLVSYMAGLFLLTFSLMSFVDILAGLLFFMHMIQHLLLLMIAPILLLLANPFPFIVWGMPYGRDIAAALFAKGAPFRMGLEKLPAGAALMLSVVFLWGWHDPAAYNAALRTGWVHDLQHLTFFIPGMLFWWKVTGAAPRMHGRFSPFSRIGLLLLMAIANVIPAVAISLSTEPIYTYYLDMPRVWGIDVLQDQIIGGIIMWIPGTMMYMLAIFVIVFRLLSKHEEKAVTADKSRYLVEKSQLA